jgi:hypothetical protein
MNHLIEIAEVESEHLKEASGIIPDEIINLLWFPDGPYKNFNPDIKENRFKIGGLFVNSSTGMGSIGSSEPSAIYYKLLIKPTYDFVNIPKLPYFPSYAGLTPEQRWIYLNWLKNIDSDVDIGYVFLFYYGLERHLVFGIYEQAFKIILRLRQNHRNNSFLNYSSNALNATCLMYDRSDLLDDYIKSEEKYDKQKISALFLITKYATNLNLSADELIALSKDLGFSNQRYIKNERKLFEKELKNILTQKYKKDSFPLSQYPIKNWPLRKEVLFINYSIDEEKRFKDLPCLINFKPFKDEIKNLLKMSHESVKNLITDIRKTTKFKPTKFN